MFAIFLGMEKSGIYTYHIKVEYEYYKDANSMETSPVSFIYIADTINNYKYDEAKLKAFKMNRICNDENSNARISYSIEGRTLRIHDTPIVFDNEELWTYFSLIDTIYVEEGTVSIDYGAFGDEPGLYNVTTVYLPGSLRNIDFYCFHFYKKAIQKIYFGGTEEQWNTLAACSDGLEMIDNAEIICNYKFKDFENAFLGEDSFIDTSPHEEISSEDSTYSENIPSTQTDGITDISQVAEMNLPAAEAAHILGLDYEFIDDGAHYFYKDSSCNEQQGVLWCYDFQAEQNNNWKYDPGDTGIAIYRVVIGMEKEDLLSIMGDQGFSATDYFGGEEEGHFYYITNKDQLVIGGKIEGDVVTSIRIFSAVDY